MCVCVCVQATVPRWQVQNEAALFWRATGNGSRALQCLRQALSSAPPSNRHLSLNNAANLLVHYGLTTHAQTLLEQALSLNATEVRLRWCRRPSSTRAFKTQKRGRISVGLRQKCRRTQGGPFPGPGICLRFRRRCVYALTSCLLPSQQPHTLFSLVSVHLAQGNVTGAVALFRHILTTALSSSYSFSSLAGCEQCRASLPLLRCLQFYPFLYNLSQRRPCPRKCTNRKHRAINTALPPVFTI